MKRLSDNVHVKVGDVDLTPGLQSVWEETKPGRGAMVTRWRIQWKGDASLLFAIDAGQELIGEVGPELKPAFAGFITATDVMSNGEVVIWAQDRSIVFQESRMGARFGDGFTPQELLYMVTKSEDPEHIEPANFHGLQWCEMPRMFVYIVPLPSVSLTTPEVQFLESRLYLPSACASADDEIIQRSLAEGMDDWKHDIPRLLTHIRAHDILRAFEKGRVRARRILDWLSLESNRRMLGVSNIGQKELLTYRRELLLSRIRSSEWAYVREIIPTGPPNRYWLRWFPPNRKSEKLYFPNDAELIADLTQSIAKRLVAVDAELLTSEERSFLNALHSLRRASQSNTEFDALVSYWEAIEYLLSGFVVDSLATKEEMKSIVRAVESCLENFSDDSSTRSSELKSAAIRSIRNMNSVPLRTKWNAFCAKRELQLTSQQDDFLWKIRQQRNNAQHGRLPVLSWSDLDRLDFIVQKAIVAQALHLQA